MAEHCRRQGVAVWAYCLMPDHVHLILVPEQAEALARAVGEAHRRYSVVVNARLRVRGHLFHSRFSSAVMDEDHLLAVARHVSLNPVRARLVARPEDWPWSSVRAHLDGCDDGLATTAPLIERCRGDFGEWLATPSCREAIRALRAAETIGRPLGSPIFLEQLVAATGRDPRPKRRGPKPQAARALEGASAGLQ
jgi:putative transposase